jgi:hypothetical protein
VTLVVHVYSTLSLQINKVWIKACKPWLPTYLPMIATVFPVNTGYLALIYCRSCFIMFFMCKVQEEKLQKGAVYIRQQLRNAFPKKFGALTLKKLVCSLLIFDSKYIKVHILHTPRIKINYITVISSRNIH